MVWIYELLWVMVVDEVSFPLFVLRMVGLTSLRMLMLQEKKVDWISCPLFVVQLIQKVRERQED